MLPSRDARAVRYLVLALVLFCPCVAREKPKKRLKKNTATYAAREKVENLFFDMDIPLTDDGRLMHADLAPERQVVASMACSMCHWMRLILADGKDKPVKHVKRKALDKCDADARKYADESGEGNPGTTPDEVHALCKGLALAIVPTMHKESAKDQYRKKLDKLCFKTRACPQDLDEEMHKRIDAEMEDTADRVAADADAIEDRIEEMVRKSGLKGKRKQDFWEKLNKLEALKEVKDIRNKLDSSMDQEERDRIIQEHMKKDREKEKSAAEKRREQEEDDNLEQMRKIQAETLNKLKSIKKKWEKNPDKDGESLDFSSVTDTLERLKKAAGEL